MSNGFVTELKKHRLELTRQQMQTLRGQALAGDVEGARRGLEKVLRRHNGREKENGPSGNRNRSGAV